MTYEEFLKEHQIMEYKAQRVDTLAANLIGKPFGEYDKQDRMEFGNKGIYIEIEYNNSCSCHPEYQTRNYTIPAKWLDFRIDPEDWEPDEEDWARTRGLIEAESERIRSKQRLKDEEDLRKKREQEESARIKLEATEKEQLRLLKDKYEK